MICNFLEDCWVINVLVKGFFVVVFLEGNGFLLRRGVKKLVYEIVFDWGGEGELECFLVDFS